MNMHTNKPLTRAVSPSELLALAEGDMEILRNSRLLARNGKPYYSRRLILLNLQKKKEEQNVTRNTSSDGRRGTSVCRGHSDPEGVGSLKLALKKFFFRLFGNRRLS